MSQENTYRPLGRKLHGMLFLAFIVFQLFVIFFHGFWTTYDVYMGVHHEDVDADLPGLNWTRQGEKLHPLYAVTGTNTGYGFYGIRVAMDKYFRVVYFNNGGDMISKDRFFGLQTANGHSRLATYANNLGNYHSDTEKLAKKEGVDEEILDFRNTYLEKSFKWIGRASARKVPGCTSYRVELISIIPRNIWDQKDRNEKPNISPIKSFSFSV